MSTRDDVIAVCANGQKFLSAEAIEYVLSNEEPVAFMNTALKHVVQGKIFLSKQDIIDAMTGDVDVEPVTFVKARNKNIPDITVFEDTNITGKSTCTGKVSDFAKYIQNRYVTLKRIIESNPSFGRSVTFEYSKKHDQDNTKVVGIIFSVKTTKNGHKMLTVEDMTGMYNVLVLASTPLIDETYIEDEVIGIIGKWNAEKTLFMPKRIVRPDIPSSHKWEPSDTTSKVMFLSDIHIGSKTFLKDDWDRAMTWLKVNADKEDIGYIVFPGDVVDGVGVFPDQDEELDMLNVYNQYDALAECLKEVPDGIKMILHPGNHDACRLAEPQPALKSVYTKSFDSNIILTGNPITMQIEGRIITSYHGKGMDDWVAKTKGLSYDNPNEIMRQMCMRRHLAPIYGNKNALCPEEKDYLVMTHVPDCLVTGHIHKASIGLYRGTRLINASTFQSQTEYQRMHNFIPTPGRVPLLNLGTGSVSMQDFHKV